MKKIGILTFHEADNYGASLQAFALQEYLSKKANCEIINYHCDYILNEVRTIKISNCSNIKRIVAFLFKKRKHDEFYKFGKEYLNLSHDYDKKNIEIVNDLYDAFIIGSDQVWNVECTNCDENYFAKFVKDGKELYSYAASLGMGSYPDKYERYLKRFNYISLREEKYIEKFKLLEKNIRIDVDPTMLFTGEKWLEYIRKRPIKRKYVFVYLVGEPIDLVKNAQKYAEENGLKLITNKKSPEFFVHCAPMDFIDWIYYAEYIFTNSFHGTVFSLLFHKEFVIESEIVNGYNNRVCELLDGVKLSSRKLENWLKNQSSVDWERVEELLAHKRRDSVEYLNKISEC